MNQFFRDYQHSVVTLEIIMEVFNKYSLYYQSWVFFTPWKRADIMHVTLQLPMPTLFNSFSKLKSILSWNAFPIPKKGRGGIIYFPHELIILGTMSPSATWLYCLQRGLNPHIEIVPFCVDKISTEIKI